MSTLNKIISRCFVFLLIAFASAQTGVFAQKDVKVLQTPDSTTFINKNDTLSVKADTLIAPSSTNNDFGLEDVVDCRSVDSLTFDIQLQKVFMYNEAEIDYQTTNLKADYVEVDFAKSLAYARGVPDSTGKVVGKPIFKEGESEFNAREMSYNYDTEKGIILDVGTQEGEGFLHGDIVKKLDDNTSNMGEGWYTTCNAEHPHFALRYKKARVIPDDKVVTGLAWVEIEDVPLPIGLPFGLFPITKGGTSGIVIPKYGEQTNRGFYLEDGGYYWFINEHFDLKLLGDIYTRGSWAVKPTLRYKKRYSYSGSFNFNYAINKTGQINTSSYAESSDFKIRWTHMQDPKARPNSSFSANVNIVSSNFNKYNPTSTNDYLSNTYSSSVSYQANLFQNKANLSLNAGMSQSTSNRTLKITLPSATLNVNRFYPLKRKNTIGKKRWYEDISVQYNMVAENSVNSIDSLLLQGYEEGNLMNMINNGMRHTVSAQSPIKILKFLNMTNSANYTERWYLQSYRQGWSSDTLISGADTTVGYVVLDTIPGFVRGYDYSFSSSVSTKLYGMLNFKRGPVRAIRHVLSPSVGFTYRPDFGNQSYGFYKSYYNENTGENVDYSIFSGSGYSSIYGTPTTGESGNVNFRLDNNLSMKVRSKRDTITGMKKVNIIDNLSFSTSYDLAKDSLNWADLAVTGRTTLFKKLNIVYQARWDPYAADSSGNRINTFQYNINKQFFRKESMSYNFSMGYSLSSSKLKKKGKENNAQGPNPDIAAEESNYGTEEEKMEVLDNPDMYLDWNNNWSLNLTYSLVLGNTYKYINYTMEDTPSYIHTIKLNGDINITPKWKVGFTTNYDLKAFELSYTQLNIYRDLHCWEMRFNWTPIGGQKGWNFTINAKSSLLQDLKLTRKKDFRDY